jgi:hypothetical protein
MVIHAVIEFGEVRHAREQILKSQQSANLFINGILVADHAVIARSSVEEKSIANDILNSHPSSIAVRITPMQNVNLFGKVFQA